MTLSDACDELAELIRNDPVLRTRGGGPIQFFYDYLKQGETPKMALTLVKKDYYEEDDIDYGAEMLLLSEDFYEILGDSL